MLPVKSKTKEMRERIGKQKLSCLTSHFSQILKPMLVKTFLKFEKHIFSTLNCYSKCFK